MIYIFSYTAEGRKDLSKVITQLAPRPLQVIPMSNPFNTHATTLPHT